MIKFHENLSKSLNEVAGVLEKQKQWGVTRSLKYNIDEARKAIISAIDEVRNLVNHNKQVIRYAGYVILSRIKEYCKELIAIEKEVKEIEKQGAEAS